MTTSDAAYRDPRRPTPERVSDLLARMSLDEKLAEISSVWAGLLFEDDRFDPAKAAPWLAHGAGQITRIGASTVLGPSQTAALMNDVQRHCVEQTRLGIPTLVHEESCAGYLAKGATQFPQAIGLASSFDPELVGEVAGVIRRQMRAVGARLTLAPVLDVARDPRWGRCEETYGEDPYLAARLGVAYVAGVQGPDLRDGVAATAKHFMGYGTSEGGLNWAPCPLGRRELLERVLPPFAAAIREAGLAAVMNGYQEIDGVPCGASAWLLDELLRDQLGFEGVVVADYFTVSCLLTYHRIAEDKTEAAARALEAGLDVELPMRDCYGAPLAEAVRSGRVDERLVDRAVARSLRLKLELGLFEQPYVDAPAAAALFDTPADRALARRCAERSLVLLHNPRRQPDAPPLLPLDPGLGRVAVIGPSAASIRNLQGDYHYPSHLEIVFGPILEGEADRAVDGERADLLPGVADQALDLLPHFPPTVSVLEGIRGVVSPGTQLVHQPGCHFRDDDRSGFDAARAAAADADVAILVLGGRSGLLRHCTSGEAVDRASLGLPGVQQQLLEHVAGAGTPLVVVIVDGRPLALTQVVPHAGALLLAWLPGEEGGSAVARALFGEVSPAGRLPVSLPRTVGQVPLYYNHKPSGARSQFHGDYRDVETTPLFPFGHGLAYTRFDWDELRIDDPEPDLAGSLEVSCRITNAGDVAADEVVQLYLRDLVASVTRPVQQLAGFARIALEPGACRRVHFDLDLRQLAFHDLAMQLVVEPGELEIMLGASCADVRLRRTIRTRGKRRAIDPARVRPTGVRVV